MPKLREFQQKLSLIVPTYQEAENIEPFWADLCNVLDRELPSQYEIIVVDHDSPGRNVAVRVADRREADVVVASRFCKGGGTGDWQQDTLLMSRAAFQAGKWMLPEVFSELTDPLSGYYLFRRTVIEGVELKPTGFKALIEILARGSARNIAECPYQMNVRRSGQSKATLESSFSFLKQLRQLQMIAGQ